jgi:tetratricopeptide (TPR) repeat protein
MENLEWKQKITWFKNELKQDQGNAQLWLDYAVFLDEECDEPEELIVAFEKAQSLLPEKDLRLRIGDAYVSAGENEKGIGLIRDYLSTNSDPGGFCILSEALRNAGLSGEARQACVDALKIDPNYEEAYFLLGELEKNTDKEKSIEHFKRAIVLDPNYQQAYSSLGRELISSISTLEEGIQYLSKAISMNEEDGWALLYLANAFWKKGQMKDAESMYLKSIQVFPDFIEAKNWFADFLDSQGRSSEANLFRIITTE